MRILLTGASGFVGAHTLRWLLHNTDAEVVCPVSFRHKGTSARLRWAMGGDPPYSEGRVKVIMHDLTGPIDAATMAELGEVDVIMNIASESHVDRSLINPIPFVRNNVDIMLNVLQYAVAVRPRLVLHMSTDEVYGPAPLIDQYDYSPDSGDPYPSEETWGPSSKEWDAILPSNPYAASKAAQEALAIAWWRSYDLPVIVTNSMNLFGETQDPEKYMAKIIRQLMRDELVPVHVGSGGVPGSRSYLYGENLASAWWHLTRRYTGGDPWNDIFKEPEQLPMYSAGFDRPLRVNIVGEREIDNHELASIVAEVMNKPLKIHEVDFHTSRPGHDLRYALDGSLMQTLGWTPPVSTPEGIDRTVEFTLRQPRWLA